MWWILLVVLAILIALWWNAATPRPEIGRHIADSVVFDPLIEQAIAAVDRSPEFAANLEQIPCDLPPYDDADLIEDGKAMVATAHDGKIWRVALDTFAARPFVDAPMMAWGIRASPVNANHVYFCSSGSYGKHLPGKSPGIYRVKLDTETLEPVVLRVPDTVIDYGNPIVYADDDPVAPEIRGDNTGGRKAVVCDNLAISADGKRIYFSEPFGYENATLDDAVDEALALAGNGRLWRHDLDSNRTRLIAEGFHFINGVLIDPSPAGQKEESVIVTQTSQFQVTRFYVNGPRAGTAEKVIDSLPGMPDGMDRDASGRIWLAMFVSRGKLLTWLHKNAWLKPFFLRLPTSLLLRQQGSTGVVVLSPDGSTPLYSAFHKGPGLTSIASAVPSRDGIYLANVSFGGSDPEKKNIQRLRWPESLAS